MADHQLTGPVSGTMPPELLEALARGVAAALAPPQPAPSSREQTTDFLTAGQFALRLGVSRETVRRLAPTWPTVPAPNGAARTLPMLWLGPEDAAE